MHIWLNVVILQSVWLYSVLYSISNFDTKNLKNSVYVIPIAAQKKSIGTVEKLYDNSSNTSILSNFTIEI